MNEAPNNCVGQAIAGSCRRLKSFLSGLTNFVWPGHIVGAGLNVQPRMVTVTVVLMVIASVTPVSIGAEQTTSLGPVTVTTRLTPDEVRIGDEVTLHLEVHAEADVEVLMPEFGEALDRYQILDYVPQQEVKGNGATTHRQRYTLQPATSGNHAIPPLLIEFIDRRPGKEPAPDGLDAYEILTDRIDFEVESVVPREAGNDLRPMLDELREETPPTPSKSAYGWLVALAVVVAIWLAVKGARRRSMREQRVNAYEFARRRLDAELTRPVPESDTEIDRYFVAVSSIVRRYLEDRFELRAPDLTTEEFLELAGRSKDLSSDHQNLLRDFLRQADLVKFAGVKTSSAEVKRAGELASRFLEETRENAPDVVLDAPDGHDLEARRRSDG